MHISSVSAVEVSETNLIIGDVKISVNCIYRPVDTQLVINRNRIRQYDINQFVKQQIVEKRKNEENEDKISIVQSESFHI
jgi:hypothetical protein